MLKPANRRKARMLALQAIYQYQFTKDPISILVTQFLQTANPKKVDIEYFSEILKGVIAEINNIDKELQTALDRKIDDLNPVELAILRLATYELLHQLDVPYKVVINEALELAKMFGSEDGYKYINGVLDNLAKKLKRK